MKFLIALLALCAALALASSQSFYGRFPSRFKSLDLVQSSASSVRDPRQNRGPVLFPPSPPNPVDESSGVVVGASGYGFVPPQQSRTFYSSAALEAPAAATYATFNYYSNPFAHQFSYF